MSRPHGPRLHRPRGERRRPDGDPRLGRRRGRATCPACGCGASPACTPPSRWASPTSPSSATRSSRVDVPARRGSGPGRPRAPDHAQGAGTRIRPPGPGTLGAARTGPGPADLRSRADRHRTPARRPVQRRGRSTPAKATKLLVVPHQEARQRLFVLAPLADVAPGSCHPAGARPSTPLAGARRPSRARRPCARSVAGTTAPGRWVARLARGQPRRRFGMTSRPKTSMNSAWFRPTLWRWTSS